MSQFSLKQARNLSEEIEFIIYRMQQALLLPDKGKAGVRAAVEDLRKYEIVKILKDVPVDELNKDKEGFKIKTLKDNGINSLADIIRLNTSQLSAIKGISEEAAYNMKRKAFEYSKNAENGIKIKLSVDDKNPATNALVKVISRYRLQGEFIDECKELLGIQREHIELAKDDLYPTLNPLRWFVTSKANKERAQKAFAYLDDLLSGEYGNRARFALGNIAQLERMTDDEGWKNFEKDPVAYFTVIEQVVPGISREGDTLYGLPEELAEEIDKEFYELDGLKCSLRRYQEWGVKYILHQENVLLGDEMGLGKTIQAIAAMVALRNAGQTHFVVVCPASVLSNWCKEIEKFSDLRFTDVYGDDRLEELEEWMTYGGVAVTTFETAVHFEMYDEFRFSMLIVDEAHYIKNPEAKRTENVKRIAEHADRKLFMTGTALENRVEEMVSLIEILNPDVAKKVKKLQFMSQAPQFREAVAPVYYRRKREDVLTELPELIESKEWCRMGAAEEAVYEDAVLEQKFADARRVSWNVDDLSKSSKAKRLAEIVDEAAQDGRKVIVFTFFLDTAAKVMELLGDKCMEPINGSVPPAKRQAIVDDFEKAEGGKVLVAQIQSGGTGLNIQTASVVVICEPQFKPSIENQAISRAYRLGQTRSVLVYRLLCENSVDEKITELLANKQAIFDAFADKSEAAQAEMTMDLDDESFGEIINQEIQRINRKRGNNE